MMLKFYATVVLAAGLAVAQIGQVVTPPFAAISVDSAQSGNPGSNAIDNSSDTFWHTEYNPVTVNLPHTAVLDLGQAITVNGFSYLPRQDGNANGRIGMYGLEVSNDKATWTVVANGTWNDDSSPKAVGFNTETVRYFRITAMTEAGNRGPWTSAANFGVHIPSNPAQASTLGSWGPVISFPLVPAAAMLVHGSGDIVTWSAWKTDEYTGGDGNTYTATYYPSSGSVSEMDVTNTGHDMFCPGLNLDADGRSIVTGGSDDYKTSSYVGSQAAWISLAQMNIPRGYQASTMLSNNKSFVIGGSWNGPVGGKNGEIYDPASNTWTVLNGCPVAPMLTNDQQGTFRADNHGWIFAWKNAFVFQAGPSSAMNWYGTSGSGTQAGAGTRGSDPDSINGNAVMYDALNGKILTLGGSPSYGAGGYPSSPATANAHIITIGDPNTTPSVSSINPMWYARAFAMSVVLPNGEVFTTGGQTLAMPFTDTNSVFTPELWNPTTTRFVRMAPHTVPRTYHSVALLMLDGRVFNGGGGLCGDCANNHMDAQIFSPPYLFNSDGSLATRPVISGISSTKFTVGSTFTITTSASRPSFAMIRYGSATHTVNTDQRRIALTPTKSSDATYTFTIPSDSGVVLPGYWMIFALSNGVPSIATTVQITTADGING